MPLLLHALAQLDAVSLSLRSVPTPETEITGEISHEEHPWLQKMEVKLAHFFRKH